MKKITTLIGAFALACFSWNASAQTAIFSSDMSIETFGSVNSPANESVGNAIDGTSNKYLDFNGADGMGFTVDLGSESKIAQSIEITTANDAPDRDGGQYEVLGSTDGTEFTSVATGSIPCVTTRHFTRQFNFENSTAYTHYRIILSERCGGGDDMYQVEEVQLYDSPFCIAPTNLTVTNLTTTSVDLEWTESDDSTLWDVEWGTTGFEQGSGTMVTGNTTNVESLSGLTPYETYDFYVRSDCGEDQSEWVGPYTFTTGYCTPSSSAGDTYVNNFSTTNGSTNISNLDSGFSTDGYFDGSELSVQTTTTGSFDFNAEIVGGTAGFSLWIDWNNDLTFDNETERFYNTTSYQNGPFTGTIEVPSETATGDYRMRIVVDYYSLNPSNPCSNGSRLEYEDYTISIVDNSCETPTDGLAENISIDSADLSWTSSGDTWDIELGTAGFTPTGTPTTAGLTTTTHNENNLLASTSYDFYVRNICGEEQSEWAGPFTFITLDEVITPCEVPTDGAANNITINSADLAWTENGSAASWDIELGLDGFTPTGTPTTSATTDNPTNIADLTSNTAYQFYVRAICDDNQSEWAGPFSFTTLEEVATCEVPTDGMANNITNESVDLAWTENGTAASWDIELGLDGFTPTGTPTTSATTDNPTNIADLTINTAYQFYVRAICDDNQSEWAGPFDFVTANIGINENDNAIGFNIYPNPNNGIFSLDINAANVSVEIVNTAGQIILSKNNVNANDKIDLRNNSKGIYFVTVTSKDKTSTQKLILK